MGYTHYFEHTSKQGLFTEDQRAQLQKVLDYWQKEGIICFEYNEENKPYYLTYDKIRFNGKGNEGHETFMFDLVNDARNCGWFCKTARKPYDQCVCEILILLKEFLGEDLDLSSDGDMFLDPNIPSEEHPWKCQFNEEWEPSWIRLKEEGFKITWADPYTEIPKEITKEEIKEIIAQAQAE